MFLYLLSVCGCNEPEKEGILDDRFPSWSQIWGMLGTIAASVTFWYIGQRLNNVWFYWMRDGCTSCTYLLLCIIFDFRSSCWPEEACVALVNDMK